MSVKVSPPLTSLDLDSRFRYIDLDLDIYRSIDILDTRKIENLLLTSTASASYLELVEFTKTTSKNKTKPN